jgi:hypothetical protein
MVWTGVISNDRDGRAAHPAGPCALGPTYLLLPTMVCCSLASLPLADRRHYWQPDRVQPDDVRGLLVGVAVGGAYEVAAARPVAEPQPLLGECEQVQGRRAVPDLAERTVTEAPRRVSGTPRRSTG